MTVGLVIISHSAQLAVGVVELAQQLTQGKTPLAAAGGGLDDILGTSADKILEAIQQVENPDGVLLLMDLGSAILSAEMALEMRNSEQPVALSYAPLVEGCVAAAIEASLGHSLAQVKRAAEQTASVKRLKQLKPLSDLAEEESETLASPSEPAPALAGAYLETHLTLRNPAGLHARPASLLVQTATHFQAQVQIQTESKNRWANAASIMEIMGLGAREGEQIVVRASGDEAQEVLDVISELVKANFYETTQASEAPSKSVQRPDLASQQAIKTPVAPQSAHEPWHGIAISQGVALGPAFLYTGNALSLQAVKIEPITEKQVASEQELLRTVLKATAQELLDQAKEVQQTIGLDEGGIFEAQALMLQDPTLRDAAETRIAQQQISAVSALAQVGEQQAQILEQLDTALLAARAVDVRDAVGRALRRLGVQADQPQDLSSLDQPVILLANDLTPSDTAQLTPERVLGICTIQGGPTTHAAIIARALGIPAISGIHKVALQTIHNGDQLGLDAEQGLLYIKPTPEIQHQFRQRIAAQQNKRIQQLQSAQETQKPLIVQGRQIHLLANIGTAAEATNARQWGAEGIGLLRTEFLFGGSQTLPDEEEQRQRYEQVFRAFLGENGGAGKPIVVRTLDAGADKPFPALEAAIGLQKEPNPALGLRGIRIHLAHEELLEVQLSALLRSAGNTDVELHIMFPMITTLEELRHARAVFYRVYKKLQQQQVKLPTHQVPVGIMVEVPAAALMGPELAKEADFFSIGANDLLQYALACDRTNSEVAYLYNPLQPAILRLIQRITTAARQAGKPVAVCGEIASDVRIAPILIGMGIDELSMTPTALSAVREVLSRSSANKLERLVQSALQASTVLEVTQACNEFLAHQDF